MIQEWFVSWCEYTSSEAGGLNVNKFGSAVKGYPTEMSPGQVLDDLTEVLHNNLQTEYVQITALNRV